MDWDLIVWLPLSTHICLGLVVEYWSIVGGCGCHSHTKLYHCAVLLLCLVFATTGHPTPAPLHATTPYIHWPNVNEFHE